MSPPLCDRCGQPATAHIMSYFNKDVLCFPCKDLEQCHPRYGEAVEAECAAVKRGDMNFPGIGKPDDL